MAAAPPSGGLASRASLASTSGDRSPAASGRRATKKKLGRERSRSFSSDSSSSFDSLFPTITISGGGGDLSCYAWMGPDSCPRPASAPPTPTTTTDAAADAAAAIDGAHRTCDTERAPRRRPTPADATDASSALRSAITAAAAAATTADPPPRECTTTTASGGGQNSDARHDVAAAAEEENDDDGDGDDEDDGDEEEEEVVARRRVYDGRRGAGAPGVVEERKRAGSAGDYLWGIATADPLPLSPSPEPRWRRRAGAHDDEETGDEDEDDTDDDDDEGNDLFVAASSARQPAVHEREQPRQTPPTPHREKHHHQHHHHQAEAAAIAAMKKSTKKRRLSLRLFSSGGGSPEQQQHAAAAAAAAADGASHQGGLSLSRVVNKLTRGGGGGGNQQQHGTGAGGGGHTVSPGHPELASHSSPAPSPLPPLASSNSLNSSSSSSAGGGGPARDGHAASILAAVGSGHFRSFSPAQQQLQPPPQLPPRAADGWGHGPPPLPHRRNMRPASCSLGAYDASTGRTRAERDELTSAAFRGSGNPPPPPTTTTTARSRMAMLTTVGSGSIGSSLSRRGGGGGNPSLADAPGDDVASASNSTSGGGRVARGGKGLGAGHKLHELALLSSSSSVAAAAAQERRNRDKEWRWSWSPSLLAPPAAAAAAATTTSQQPRRPPPPPPQQHSPQPPQQHSSQPPQPHRPPPLPSAAPAGEPSFWATTTTTTGAPLALPPGAASAGVASPRGRSITIPSSGVGDQRVFALLQDLHLTKYWHTFAREEILLEDLDDMQEQDLIVDFAMTKWHAKRLLRTVEQLRAISPSSPLSPGLFDVAAASITAANANANAASSSSSTTVSGADHNSPAIAQASHLPTAPLQSDSAAGVRPTDGTGDHHATTTTAAAAEEGAVVVVEEEKRRGLEGSGGSGSKKKKKGAKDKKARRKRRKEREKIEREWAKLRQERERLALEQQAAPPSKRSIADLEFRELNVADIEWEDHVLAHGRFGVVYRGRWRGVECALKQLRVDVSAESDETERLLRAFKKEASLMQALGYHPNCICFFGAVTLGGRLCLVSEWAANGSVYDLLVKRKEEVPLKTLVKLARDAACGILHLHSEKVIHRDIAARNVLVGQDYTGKISDLGLSRVMTTTTMTTDSAGNSNIGAIKWMSPESITTNEYNEKSDAFSFGVFLWELLTREMPWGNMPAMQVALLVVNEGKRLVTPEDCDPVLRGLVEKCFASAPHDRPDFHEIFATLDNYHKCLVENDARAPLLPLPPPDGGLPASIARRPAAAKSGRVGGPGRMSEDSSDSTDDDSSSSSGHGGFEEDMILQYARVGGGGGVHT